MANHVDWLLPQAERSRIRPPPGSADVHPVLVFLLAVPTAVLPDAGEPVISRTPTHIVISRAELFEVPAGAKITIEPLAPGARVTPRPYRDRMVANRKG